MYIMITVIIFHSLFILWLRREEGDPKNRPYRTTVCGSLHCSLYIAEQLALSTNRSLSKYVFRGLDKELLEIDDSQQLYGFECFFSSVFQIYNFTNLRKQIKMKSEITSKQ